MTYVLITEEDIRQLLTRVAILAKKAGITKTALKNYIDGVYRI